MKNKFKKLFSLIFATMMMITTMWTVKTTVQAATVSDGGYSGYWVRVKNTTLTNGNKILPQRLHFHNGTPAYCIEPKKAMKIGQDVYATSSLEDYKSLSASTKQKISAISYFGYGHNGRKEPIHYIATQILIWQTLDSKYKDSEVHYLPNNPQYGHLSNANKVTDKVKTIKAAILKDVNRYEASLGEPNFQIYGENGKKVGKTGQHAKYENGIVGKTYTVVDQKNVLKYKNLTKNTFSNAKVSGNKVTITLTEKDLNTNHTMSFRGKEHKIGVRPIILYGSAQNVIVRGDLNDPGNGSITIRAIGRTAKIQKLTEGQLALAGAKLGLYEDVNKNGKYDVGEPKVKEFTTTEKATAIEGLVPGKKYVLHELKAPKGYVRAEDVAVAIKDKDVTIKMMDKAMDVVVKKVTDKGDKVADVTLTILNEDGSVATDKDGNKAVYKTKADTDWNVSKYLQEGKKYILRETEVVAGVHIAKDVMFTAPKKGDKTLSVTVTMVDKEIDVIVKKVTEKGDRVAD
ncbi:Cys-Gln thioester bond-forming surface protein, partial [Bulleidia sp. zg-1006]